MAELDFYLSSNSLDAFLVSAGLNFIKNFMEKDIQGKQFVNDVNEIFGEEVTKDELIQRIIEIRNLINEALVKGSMPNG